MKSLMPWTKAPRRPSVYLRYSIPRGLGRHSIGAGYRPSVRGGGGAGGGQYGTPRLGWLAEQQRVRFERDSSVSSRRRLQSPCGVTALG
jgi:hypothetical protein